MMRILSRKSFLSFCGLFSLMFPWRAHALQVEKNSPSIGYPDTLFVLKQAYETELIAHRHYLRYVEKALADKFQNIAYMFHVFSFSEKIHADNNARIINELGRTTSKISVTIHVRDTKSNLATASEKEIEKIKTTYPRFLKKLAPEGYEEAIINCMYSWKSHRQHEKEVKKYSATLTFFLGLWPRKSNAS